MRQGRGGRFAPPSQGPELSHSPDTPYGVEASFENLDAARGAIEALGNAGIEGQRISLRGPGAEEAAEKPETAEADARLVRHGAGYALGGGLIGCGLGLIVAIAGILISGADVSSTELVAIAGLSALGGAIVGALVAAMWSMQATETWALTFQRSSQSAIVRVQSADAEEVERAAGILGGFAPRSLRRIDESHRRVAS
jgi:hypothetical protein